MVYTYFLLFSDFGGIIGIIFPIIYFINSDISYNMIMAKLIGKLYYHKPDIFKTSSDLSFTTAYLYQRNICSNQVNRVQKLKFSIPEQIYDTFLQPLFCCFKKTKYLKQMNLYQNMKNKLED